MVQYGFLILFTILLVMRIPLAFCLGISSAFYFLVSGNPIITLSQMTMSTFDSFTLLAIPLFMLAGHIMNSGGVTNRLFGFAKTLVGHIPGGLGQVNVVASLIFAGISGSATADAAGLGTIEIEYMKKEKYDAPFSAAVTAASSTLGTIMPPSLGFVVYGAMTGTSVGALFLAGLLPAGVMAIAMMVVVYVIAKKNNYPVAKRATIKELWESFRHAFFPLLSPIIILGGITTGIVTPTEAAVVALLYAIILGIVYKELTLKKLIHDFISVGKLGSKVMLIVSFALVFGWILTYERIPNQVAELLTSFTDNPFILLIILNVMILVLGCFMEGISIKLITLPIILPLLQAVNIDLLHFGVLMELNLNIGLITPPVGVFIYLVADIAGITFEDVTKALVPFMAILVFVLFILTFLPQISVFLPNLLLYS